MGKIVEHEVGQERDRARELAEEANRLMVDGYAVYLTEAPWRNICSQYDLDAYVVRHETYGILAYLGSPMATHVAEGFGTEDESLDEALGWLRKQFADTSTYARLDGTRVWLHNSVPLDADEMEDLGYDAGGRDQTTGVVIPEAAAAALLRMLKLSDTATFLAQRMPGDGHQFDAVRNHLQDQLGATPRPAGYNVYLTEDIPGQAHPTEHKPLLTGVSEDIAREVCLALNQGDNLLIDEDGDEVWPMKIVLAGSSTGERPQFRALRYGVEAHYVSEDPEGD